MHVAKTRLLPRTIKKEGAVMEEKVTPFAIGLALPLVVYTQLDKLVADVSRDFTPFLVAIAVLFIVNRSSGITGPNGRLRHPFWVGFLLGFGLGSVFVATQELYLISLQTGVKPLPAVITLLILVGWYALRFIAYFRQEYIAVEWD